MKRRHAECATRHGGDAVGRMILGFRFSFLLCGRGYPSRVTSPLIAPPAVYTKFVFLVARTNSHQYKIVSQRSTYISIPACDDITTGSTCCCTANLSTEYCKMHKQLSVDEPERKQGIKLIICRIPSPCLYHCQLLSFTWHIFFMPLALYSLTLHCLRRCIVTSHIKLN